MEFTNSDAGMIDLFLRFLEALGHERDGLVHRLNIHQEADVDPAKAWWIAQLSLPAQTPIAVYLKRHNPSPRRHHRGEDYHGCLVVRVRRASRLYWRIEGIANALLGGG